MAAPVAALAKAARGILKSRKHVAGAAEKGLARCLKKVLCGSLQQPMPSSSRQPTPTDPIAYSEAATIVSRYAAALSPRRVPETVSLLEAPGRVLARPVLADREQPPFPRSTRDGFACRADDLVGAGSLSVLGLLKAGETWAGASLEPGQAVEIMTGAPLPPGADCVLMVEHVDLVADEEPQRPGSAQAGRIRIQPGRQVRAGENFIPNGAEAAAGATLVATGTRISPAQIAAAASVGAACLDVYPRPRVAILATGDELVSIEDRPLADQIRNSNSYSLAAQVLALGGEALIQPVAADSEAALEASIRTAVADGCELLLLSGGVSMGKYDLVEAILASLGAQFFFTGARIQPGKPVVFGELTTLGRLPFFGLPGNPVSTMVTFLLFAAPVLAALGGELGYAPRFAEARLADAASLKPNLRRFLPGRLNADAERATVTLVPWQGSGDIAATSQANCLVVLPEATSAATSGESTILAAGSAVRVLLL